MIIPNASKSRVKKNLEAPDAAKIVPKSMSMSVSVKSEEKKYLMRTKRI